MLASLCRKASAHCSSLFPSTSAKCRTLGENDSRKELACCALIQCASQLRVNNEPGSSTHGTPLSYQLGGVRRLHKRERVAQVAVGRVKRLLTLAPQHAEPGASKPTKQNVSVVQLTAKVVPCSLLWSVQEASGSRRWESVITLCTSATI